MTKPSLLTLVCVTSTRVQVYYKLTYWKPPPNRAILTCYRVGDKRYKEVSRGGWRLVYRGVQVDEDPSGLVWGATLRQGLLIYMWGNPVPGVLGPLTPSITNSVTWSKVAPLEYLTNSIKPSWFVSYPCDQVLQRLWWLSMIISKYPELSRRI